MRIFTALCLAALSTLPAAAAEPPAPPLLTVSGHGEVSLPPDRAVVRLGAEVQAAEAGTAQSRVNRIMQQAITAIRGAGVAADRIRTTALSLSPVYQSGIGKAPRIVGYRASDVITVEVDNLARVGRVIDAATTAGVNRLEGLTFGLRDDGAAKRQALGLAVREARAKAGAMAEALDAVLGPVEEVQEGGIDLNGPRPVLRAYAAKAAIPVLPGRMKVEASVTLKYRLGGKPSPGRN